MDILYSDEKQSKDQIVTRQSSIEQYNKVPLRVERGGVSLPISFDTIDYVMCDCIVNHRTIMVEDDFIGYHYPVRRCDLTSDLYVYFDQKDEVMKQLPAWMGEGFYRDITRGKAYLNSDTNSLGEHNTLRGRVGLDYIRADTIVKPAD